MAGLAVKSISDYREFCGRFINSIGFDLEYEELNQEKVSEYILKLMEQSISKTTMATYIRHCKIFLKWCTENYSVSAFDYKKIRVPKSPKKNVIIYSNEEIKQIFKKVTAESDWMITRNCAIVSLMLDSGLRQAEITRIKIKDINFKKNNLNVHGKGDKDRVVPLGNISLGYINKYLEVCPYSFSNKDYLFITREKKRITTNTVKLMITKIARKLPFELSSHKLRHNFATNYCLNQYREYGQIDIYQLMYLLGHEDVKTTSRYLHFAYEIIASEKSISHVDKVFFG